MDKFIPQMEPCFGKEEWIALDEYMKAGGWVTEFKKTREFENIIAKYTDSKFCYVVANGTISLVLALQDCEVKPGDEVIVPDFTMVATSNSAELIGAKAVFVDIDKRNFCIDFDKTREAITRKTKAIILVTISGRYP